MDECYDCYNKEAAQTHTGHKRWNRERKNTYKKQHNYEEHTRVFDKEAAQTYTGHMLDLLSHGDRHWGWYRWLLWQGSSCTDMTCTAVVRKRTRLVLFLSLAQSWSLPTWLLCAKIGVGGGLIHHPPWLCMQFQCGVLWQCTGREHAWPSNLFVCTYMGLARIVYAHRKLQITINIDIALLGVPCTPYLFGSIPVPNFHKY
jgi:hypothetical protein